MAIAPTVLDAQYSGVDGADYVTESVSPTAGSILYLFFSSTDSVPEPIDTVSGVATTWSALATYQMSSGGVSGYLHCYEGVGPFTPGTITLSWAGTQTSAAWTVIQITGHDTSNPSPQAAVTATGYQSASATLSALQGTDSIALYGGACKADGTAVATPSNSFTELSDANGEVPNNGTTTGWKVNATNPAYTVTGTNPGQAYIIAIEVKAAPVVGGDLDPFGMSGIYGI